MAFFERPLLIHEPNPVSPVLPPNLIMRSPKISALFTTLALLSLGATAVAAPRSDDDWEDFSYGIYEDLGLVDFDSPELAAKVFAAGLEGNAQLELLMSRAVTPPDYVQDDADERDGRRGWLICMEDHQLLDALAAAGPKYVVAGQVRVGFHEEPAGLRMTMLQPETFVRIVGNDMEKDAYLRLAAQAAAAAEHIRSVARATVHAPCPGTQMEPTRDGDELWDGDRDMFMMVGKMTYFLDEDQFPLLWSKKATADPQADLEAAVELVKKNLAAFDAEEDDLDYRWTPAPKKDLAWTIQTRQDVPKKAVLLTVSRPRTEALAMTIAGRSRSESDWRSPGLDHLTAFPIEVLIYIDEGQVQLRTAREMFRMDQFFWDAGKMSFMKYKNMPGMLDDSLELALTGDN